MSEEGEAEKSAPDAAPPDMTVIPIAIPTEVAQFILPVIAQVGEFVAARRRKTEATARADAEADDIELLTRRARAISALHLCRAGAQEDTNTLLWIKAQIERLTGAAAPSVPFGAGIEDIAAGTKAD